MLAKVLCLALFLNCCSAAIEDDLKSLFNNKNMPFSELPCINIGGSCARSNSCPKGTRVGVKGLCPIQQEEGIECCIQESRIKMLEVKCASRGGECVANTFQCPEILIFRKATDCSDDQKCCIFVN